MTPNHAPDEHIRDARRRQYAGHLARLTDPVDRRRFLKLMGASLALAGATGCIGPPREKIVPYVRPPEEVVPGKPLFYASATTLGGFATGVLIETHEGRPTKVEGNPQHPASLGGTDAFTQASLLTLYAPDRSQAVLERGAISTWESMVAALRTALAGPRANQGAGLRFLTETVTSPTLADQMHKLLAQYPQARWHKYEPVSRENARAGARLVFGQDAAVRYRLDAADVVLVLDGDFLATDPGRIRYIHDLADGRRIRAGRPTMSRLYVIESTPTLAGSVADHRLPMPPSQIEAAAYAVAAAVGVDVGPRRPPPPPGLPPGWLAALAADLAAHRGSSLVIAGDPQPPAVHALAHAINDALGNAGKTVEYTDLVEVDPVDDVASLRALTADAEAGQVQVLAILGGNPAYTAPADVDFAAALAKVPFSVHLGLFDDETAAICQWHVPELHPAESWTDARAYDGTTTIMQPVIAPLYGGHSAHELLVAFGDQLAGSSHDLVKGYWQSQRQGGDFDAFWRTSLHDGLVAGSALPAKPLAPRAGWQTDLPAPAATQGPPGATDEIEVVFRPDPTVHDGRFAGNGWLQELPKPLTKLTWDNAALVAPALAARLGLSNEDVVELSYGGRTVRAPVLVVAGHPDGVVTVPLGYGRRRGAGAGNGVGFDGYALRTAAAPWFARGLAVRKTGETYRLAIKHGAEQMAGRPIIPTTTLDGFRRKADFPAEQVKPPEGSLYPGFTYNGYAWGMAIDLNACVGCSACVVACEAENNSPIVGKDQVARDREMQWLRVDTYVEGDPANPRTYHQLVPCQQCENAPCELVCPVDATTHSSEGLNDMVYNRCVGTRYCSNNCPYKVRRFNFFQYQDYRENTLALMRNPDVTVRSRGVMEKCTYCVQRINQARIQAEKEGRTIRDGEVLTACQAACPASAIYFGDINDPNSQVSQVKREPHNYQLLAELNTRPRTSYLGVVRNPNPAIGG